MTNLPQSLMSKDKLLDRQLGRHPLWLKALLLLTTFALGGLIAMELVQRLFQSLMYRLVTVEAQADILNALDHLLPYRLGYAGVTLLLSWITVGAYLWLKTRSRIAIPLTLIIPLILLIGLWASRALGSRLSVPPIAPTATATAIPAPTATPAAVKTQTYHNTAVGFELDYPTGWVIDTGSEAAGTVILWSKKVEGPGTDGVPADVVKMDIVVPSVTVQSLDELVAWEKQIIADASHTVLHEQPVQLPSGLAAVQMHVSGMGEALVLLTLINDQPLIVAGYGDLSRFTGVAQTLRPVSPTSRAASAGPALASINGWVWHDECAVGGEGGSPAWPEPVAGRIGGLAIQQ